MKRSVSPIALIGLSGLGMWLSSRMTWLTVDTFDDKAGGGTSELVGAVWAPELPAIALGLLAGVFALIMVGAVGRRVIATLLAVLSVVASWSGVVLLTGGPDSVDTSRALDLLTSGMADSHALAGVSVADWAQVENLQIHYFGPALAVLSCAVTLFSAVLVVRRPGATARRKSNAYETPEVRRQRLEADLAEDPQSGRVLWDALDAGLDPTAVESATDTVRK